jgi:hypothetical protein
MECYSGRLIFVKVSVKPVDIVIVKVYICQQHTMIMRR